MNLHLPFSQFSKDQHFSLLHSQVSSQNSLLLLLLDHSNDLLSLYVVDEFEVLEELKKKGEEEGEVVESLEVERGLLTCRARVFSIPTSDEMSDRRRDSGRRRLRVFVERLFDFFQKRNVWRKKRVLQGFLKREGRGVKG